MSNWQTILGSIGISVLVVVVLFVVSLVPTGQRSITTIETIQGIPYPTRGTGIQITEPLAHVDIELREPVFAKSLQLEFKYRPGNAHHLAVGVRQNSFWLSYPLHFFHTSDTPLSSDWQTATVTIPLTTALQDTNRTIDVMFVADPLPDLIQTATQPSSATSWELRDVTARVAYDPPSLAEVKGYIRGVVSKERAL